MKIDLTKEEIDFILDWARQAEDDGKGVGEEEIALCEKLRQSLENE